MQYGLEEETLGALKGVFSKITTIEKVILYGSRAKGNFQKGSDIDIVLIGNQLNLDNSVYPLMEQIEELYLPYSFDISIFSEIDNIALIKHIDQCGVQLYTQK